MIISNIYIYIYIYSCVNVCIYKYVTRPPQTKISDYAPVLQEFLGPHEKVPQVLLSITSPLFFWNVRPKRYSKVELFKAKGL